MTRRLVLKSETLTELATGDLRSVVGGGGTHLTCYTGETVCGLCAMIAERPDIPSVDSPCQTV